MHFARRGTKSVHTIVLNEREWISVLVALNSTEDTMPNHHIFKEKKPREEFILLCKDGACMGIQDNGYMDVKKFSKCMIIFLNYHESRGNLSYTKMMLLILNGYKVM